MWQTQHYLEDKIYERTLFIFYFPVQYWLIMPYYNLHLRKAVCMLFSLLFAFASELAAGAGRDGQGAGSCLCPWCCFLQKLLLLLSPCTDKKGFSRFVLIFVNISANTSDYYLCFLWQVLISKGLLYINTPAILYDCETHYNHPREEFFSGLTWKSKMMKVPFAASRPLVGRVQDRINSVLKNTSE